MDMDMELGMNVSDILEYSSSANTNDNTSQGSSSEQSVVCLTCLSSFTQQQCKTTCFFKCPIGHIICISCHLKGIICGKCKKQNEIYNNSLYTSFESTTPSPPTPPLTSTPHQVEEKGPKELRVPNRSETISVVDSSTISSDSKVQPIVSRFDFAAFAKKLVQSTPGCCILNSKPDQAQAVVSSSPEIARTSSSEPAGSFNVVIPCQYEKYGCTVTFITSEQDSVDEKLHLHHKSCEFRPTLKCFLPDKVNADQICRKVVPRDNFISHARIYHGATEYFSVIKQSIPFAIDVNTKIQPKDLPKCHYIHFHSLQKEYLTCVAIDPECNSLCWWTYMFGGDMIQFLRTVVTLTIENPNCEIPTSLSWSGPAHRIRSTPQEIIENGVCLQIPRSHFQTLVYSDKVRNITEWIFKISMTH